uniref:Uncharacterized protein n=1 Tax=Arundo donax TaxID=35708 RepID=A0A0A8ZMB0_ARUDO
MKRGHCEASTQK